MENTDALKEAMMDKEINNAISKQEKLNQLFARIISYLFHPAIIPTYVALLLVFVQQKEQVQLFTAQDVNSWVINIFLSTFFFPVVFVLLLRALKFIDSIHLDEQKSRIIPLIGTMVFYFWCNEIFRNIETNEFIRMFILGSFWGIIAVFMTNIFLKVSMHTSAMGGAITMVILQLIIYPSLMNLLILLGVFLIAGIVGTCRLYLKAHSQTELWVGYALGIIIQLAAYLFIRFPIF